jgi:hypothetical protein
VLKNTLRAGAHMYILHTVHRRGGSDGGWALPMPLAAQAAAAAAGRAARSGEAVAARRWPTRGGVAVAARGAVAARAEGPPRRWQRGGGSEMQVAARRWQRGAVAATQWQRVATCAPDPRFDLKSYKLTPPGFFVEEVRVHHKSRLIL